MAKRIVKPILDVQTGKEYESEAAAGRALAHLVKGDPKDSFVFFKIKRRLPDRLRTRNAAGEWVKLDDPSAPIGTLRARADDRPAQPSSGGTRTTTLEIDEGKFDAVKRILGTVTLRETVDRSFDEVLAGAARRSSIAQLKTMEGLDLDKPAVMEKAWRG